MQRTTIWELLIHRFAFLRSQRFLIPVAYGTFSGCIKSNLFYKSEVEKARFHDLCIRRGTDFPGIGG